MPPEDLRRQVAASMGTAISRGQAPLHRRSQQAPRRLSQNQIKCSICAPLICSFFVVSTCFCCHFLFKLYI